MGRVLRKSDHPVCAHSQACCRTRPLRRLAAVPAIRMTAIVSKEGISMSANHDKRPTMVPVWCSLVIFVGLLACPSPVAHAGTPPLLEFDAPFCIGCRSIPCNDAAKKDPVKDLIEV